MGPTRARVVPVLVVLALLIGAGCRAGPEASVGAGTLRDDAVTVGSFDFAESELLAEIYSQALEAGGIRVHRALDLGPRELVVPALARGLVELVPEYSGTALQFLSLGQASMAPERTAARAAIDRVARPVQLMALDPSPAEDSNVFVITTETARREGLRTLSDLTRVEPEVTFGGPPECSTRPLCLQGLGSVYGLAFREVLALDAGGPLTRQALINGDIDVGLLFSTDPAIDSRTLVALTDDRSLQPHEYVTPLLRSEVVARWGTSLVDRLDAVSAGLTTDELRLLNARVANGAAVAKVAADWLDAEGLR
jgi:osmoprotectant transport system substrate-binding protein